MGTFILAYICLARAHTHIHTQTKIKTTNSQIGASTLVDRFPMDLKKTFRVLYLVFLPLHCPSGFHPNLAPSFNLPLSLYSNEFYLLLP